MVQQLNNAHDDDDDGLVPMEGVCLGNREGDHLLVVPTSSSTLMIINRPAGSGITTPEPLETTCFGDRDGEQFQIIDRTGGISWMYFKPSPYAVPVRVCKWTEEVSAEQWLSSGRNEPSESVIIYREDLFEKAADLVRSIVDEVEDEYDEAGNNQGKTRHEE